VWRNLCGQMANNYFFVDGGALLADVKKAIADLQLPGWARLDLVAFAQYFAGLRFHHFTRGSYRRFVFYFVQNDERLRKAVRIPDFSCPDAVQDLRIEFCGKRIKHFDEARSWLEEQNAPESVRECLYRSEKAVDTQICCDALHLAATNKLDRLFLYTNEYDFVPLCRALRQLSANVNLFRMQRQSVNALLVSECDAFHVFVDEGELRASFVDQDGNPFPRLPPCQ
jgi:uncharacterized LabA/DUF88 family protein